jgi:polyphenol oxidase
MAQQVINLANNRAFYFGSAKQTADGIQQQLGAQSLIILNQVHGNKGHVITKENGHMPHKSADGDFLLTNEAHIGLGVLTADCLPIIFVDRKQSAIGIAHAGWRGSVQNIAAIALQRMQQEYSTNVQDISVFFGPCAKVCCYQVQEDFLVNIASFPFANRTFVRKKNILFFDLIAFNKYQLLSFGLPQTLLHDQYNYCTICNEDYYSYRRQGDAAGRQVSAVVIK